MSKVSESAISARWKSKDNNFSDNPPSQSDRGHDSEGEEVSDDDCMPKRSGVQSCYSVKNKYSRNERLRVNNRTALSELRMRETVVGVKHRHALERAGPVRRPGERRQRQRGVGRGGG